MHIIEEQHFSFGSDDVSIIQLQVENVVLNSGKSLKGLEEYVNDTIKKVTVIIFMVIDPESIPEHRVGHRIIIDEK
jgi:uncharacterized protein (UPF0248 family)